MIHAAGILFLAPNDRALFLKRGKSGDHAGEWCFPGGKLEKDELPEDAAEREAREELGHLPAGVMVEHTRRQDDETDFTTFRQHVTAEFHPNKKALNEEHVGFAWAPVGDPPEPLHQGCKIALERLNMDELGVARAVAAGELVSPQEVENMSLFAMRMSGTGASYRKQHDEYVWRDPEIYLSQDMIDRCAGLPVIMEHPSESTLTSDEFANRIVGTVMFGYIKGDDLWCVTRIYDDTTRQLLRDNQLSTSPAVVFRDPSVNSKMKMEDGSIVLIEGRPSLLDHLAICEKGVWDKGGDPTGIDVVRKDSVMSDEEKKVAADKARHDSDEAEMKKKEEEAKSDAAKADAAKADAAKADSDKLDKLLTHMDSLSKRMDAWDAKMDAEEEEKKADKKADEDEKEKEKEKEEKADSKKDGEICEKGDPKELAADKSKKDDDEDDKKEKEKMDRKDSEAAISRLVQEGIAKAMDVFKEAQPKPASDADKDAMADAQTRADRFYSAWNKSAPRPNDGETQLAYRRRLAMPLQSHSPKWKDANLAVLAVDPATFAIAEEGIYSDSWEAAMHPTAMGAGELRERSYTDPTSGHRIKEYYGDPMAWMSQFTGGRRVARFNLGKQG